MKNIDKMPPSQIIDLIKTGLDYLIQGFSKIGFRRKTNERLQKLEEQVALLSQKALNDSQ